MLIHVRSGLIFFFFFMENILNYTTLFSQKILFIIQIMLIKNERILFFILRTKLKHLKIRKNEEGPT